MKLKVYRPRLRPADVLLVKVSYRPSGGLADELFRLRDISDTWLRRTLKGAH